MFHRFFRFGFFLIVVSFIGIASAHQTKLSSSRLVAMGPQISGQVELNAVDLSVALGRDFVSESGVIAMDLLERNTDQVHRYLNEHVRLFCDDAPVAPLIREDIDVKGDHVIFYLVWSCVDPSIPTQYSSTLFQEIDPQSRHMVSVTGDREFIALLDVTKTSLALSTQEPSLGELIYKFVISGIEHIAIGFDHIAFLLAVIVLGRSFYPLFKVVTAFTIAHSITLSLAVLDVFSVPSSFVEPLIALSIVYVAVENFFVKDISKRYWVTFIFGLIHGFGFASVLRDYGLPENGIGWALASFNIGVEIGQLLIVLLAVVLWKLVNSTSFFADIDRGHTRQRMLSLVISGAVLLLGAGWFIERVFL